VNAKRDDDGEVDDDEEDPKDWVGHVVADDLGKEDDSDHGKHNVCVGGGVRVSEEDDNFQSYQHIITLFYNA
jgi:hypothetical protein